MIRSQLTLDLHSELIVDNFAGGGGASTGIELGLGRCVDIADNHDPQALFLHATNHPQTRHLCKDVFEVDPTEVCAGRPVGLAWFSPDCKHFSKAKGGKPKSKKIRGLAWVMVKWAATVKPRVMILENVEEFQTWGPLLPDGQPCPKRKGKTFRNFVARLRNLGYAVEWRELRACDYGAPTIRKRLFLIARCDGQPIVWPEPTHGKPGSREVLAKQRKPWRTAAECIDWSIPCPSIFERKRPLKDATLRRIARGIMKFVVNAAEPFIVPVTHQGSDRVESIREPFRTVTGAHRGEKAVCVPHITKFRTGSIGSDMSDLLPTVTAGPKEDPAGAPHAMGVVAATLVQTGYGEREGQSPRSLGIEKPLGTVVGGGQKHAVVEVHAAPFFTECANASSERVFDPQEPMRTQCAEVKGGHFAECCAFLAKHYGGNETPGAPLDKPCDTVTAVDHHALVTANIVGCGGRMGQSPARGMNEPAQTLTSKADSCVVTSHLSKLYGTTTGQGMDEPMHTVTGSGNHIAEVRAFLIKYYGNEKEGVDIREPMHTVTAKDRVGLVTIHGEDYVITDIGMRMLEPHELYAAQGFPKNYIIAPIWNGKPLPKHAQVRMCGNSVCPPLAEALVRANVPELSAWEPKERVA